MAETTLVRSTLTSGMIDAGRSLVAGLDESDITFEAAFWLSEAESGFWHLVLSTKIVKMEGSRALYSKVDKVLLKLRLQPDIWIGMISIVGDTTPVVKSLRRMLGSVASVDGTRLDDALIGGIPLPGCFLYRLSRRQKLQETHVT